jgi:hypothetical protein
MNHLERLLDLLPPPYAIASDSLVSQILVQAAAEMEAYQEDLDRMRQTHWIRFCYRLQDAEKLGALVGVKRFPWEDLRLYRARLIPTVVARLRGALGPNEVRNFCYDYLTSAEKATGISMVPGLQTVTAEQAFQGVNDRPLFRKLELVENPPVARQSVVLAARGGNVPYLFRWEDVNKGMQETVPTLFVSGVIGRRSVCPVLVNLTTGELIGYRGRVPFGQTLTIASTGDASEPRMATAALNGADVTDQLFSMDGFQMGVPFQLADLEPRPLLPRLVRGRNAWVFLSVALYDVHGLDRFFSAIAGETLREGVFNQTNFDQSLFPSGTMANLALEWTEAQPASYEVRVPRFLVREPAETEMHGLVSSALEESIGELRAAGVRSGVRFLPFAERQTQRTKVTLPWVVLPPQAGTAGENEDLALGGQFGESPLGSARFE